MSNEYLPRYFIVGARPVALLPTEDGGLECVALNWDTGELERNAAYLTRVSMPSDPEVDVVTKEEFDEAVGRFSALNSASEHVGAEKLAPAGSTRLNSRPGQQKKR